MNGYTIEKMVMAATAGLIQINSTETVGYWGDERLFDLPVKSLFHSFAHFSKILSVFSLLVQPCLLSHV